MVHLSSPLLSSPLLSSPLLSSPLLSSPQKCILSAYIRTMDTCKASMCGLVVSTPAFKSKFANFGGFNSPCRLLNTVVILAQGTYPSCCSRLPPSGSERKLRRELRDSQGHKTLCSWQDSEDAQRMLRSGSKTYFSKSCQSERVLLLRSY